MLPFVDCFAFSDHTLTREAEVMRADSGNDETGLKGGEASGGLRVSGGKTDETLAPSKATTPPRSTTSVTEEPIWERIAREAQELPATVRGRLPRDGARNLDHYLYGAPKEQE